MMGKDARERDPEQGLLSRLRDFLLELRVGSAFVGSQHCIQVGQEEFFVDLLFYHLELRCYVVIDLKMTAFSAGICGENKLLSIGCQWV
jgi:predicted nuclease of restriction endonuclease-like (RecB) superfamily